MNTIYKHNNVHWWLTKFSYYWLPLLFLLSCSSPNISQKFGLFNENDFMEYTNDDFNDDYIDIEWINPDAFDECIMLYRDDTESSIKDIKKITSNPYWNTHTLYPCVEKISLENDTLKNK